MSEHRYYDGTPCQCRACEAAAAPRAPEPDDPYGTYPCEAEPSADATAGEREIDALLADFQAACEECVQCSNSDTTMNRAILRNALRAKLLAARSTPPAAPTEGICGAPHCPTCNALMVWVEGWTCTKHNPPPAACAEPSRGAQPKLESREGLRPTETQRKKEDLAAVPPTSTSTDSNRED